jgi:hypothetical protein
MLTSSSVVVAMSKQLGLFKQHLKLIFAAESFEASLRSSPLSAKKFLFVFFYVVAAMFTRD